MTQSIQHIMSKIGILSATFLLAIFCIFAPQHEASALDYEFKAGIGYEMSFMHDSLITSDASDDEVSYLPGGTLDLEFSFLISNWFAVSLEAEGGVMAFSPTYKVLVNLRFMYRHENFEFAAKAGFGMHTLGMAAKVGLAFSYFISDDWCIGISMNYTPRFNINDDDDDIVNIHSIGTIFHFGYRF